MIAFSLKMFSPCSCVTIATHTSRPELAEVAQVLQQQLQKAGFKVELVVRDYARLESDLLAGKFDAFVSSRNVVLDTGDPATVLASDYTCKGTYNLSLLCDKTVDKAVAEAQAVTDPAAREDAVMKAEAAILATDAEIPLVHLKGALGIATSVEGVVLDPYERVLVGKDTRR